MSGVAALLELARALHQADCVPELTIVIVAFDLEEIGSEGSQQFIQAGSPSSLSVSHIVTCQSIITGVPAASPTDQAWPPGDGAEVTVCGGHHHGLPPRIRHGGGITGQQRGLESRENVRLFCRIWRRTGSN